ncbi:hypothetical protein Dsin_012481 [Dipteronia sinensis]|uniref:Retrotransposon Copia-like N-terminal domain-containing protein n=1 Tax=Dipteronia sinensis TaxID=43782 RepID=A0AAE0E824_9ROSI|nr:hypothetical protein Dsin_012481 [Dipteronia sinensis]
MSNEFQLITINISAQAPLKLTTNNYVSWKLQFQTLFIGYDLFGLEDDYKELVRTVQGRDTPITCDELHEKLLTFEASLQRNKKEYALFPATANPTNRTNTNWCHQNFNNNWRPYPLSNTGWRPSPNTTSRPPMSNNSGTPPRGNRPPPRPYLSRFQCFGIQGHTAKRCSSFQLVPI